MACFHLGNLKKEEIMVTAQEIVTNLIKGFEISKETLAGKMGVHTNTIVRWGRGSTKPTYAELKLLNQIYRGHKVIKRRK